ncbi:MAG: hypothetical protein R3356_02660 [Eudoraea sp.]|nr:hypothetical protein [Eudoraea sp.]
MNRITTLVLSLLILASCSREDAEKEKLLESITSAVVAFAYEGPEMNSFLSNPERAYISGYFFFEPDLADDIVFGLDIEWFEGVDSPIHFEGADWMALAGFQRTGIFWARYGSSENLTGTPTISENWEIRDIGQELSPNTWYQMVITADFGLREFVSVRLIGGSLDEEIDLQGLPLDYPNYAPFDKPSLNYYTHALRSKNFSPDNQGGTRVFFDDLELGLQTTVGNQVLFRNGFENQNLVQDIPLSSPLILMEDITENLWYFENERAKVGITNEYARSGENSIACNASLLQID